MTNRAEQNWPGDEVVEIPTSQAVNAYGEPIVFHGRVCSRCTQRVGVNFAFSVDRDGFIVCDHYAVRDSFTGERWINLPKGMQQRAKHISR